MSKLQIAGVVKESFVDGPGIRFVIFTQGCHHACKGCHNPHTHDPNGGYFVDTADLLEDFSNNPSLSGMTISGGEPILQFKSLLPLAEQVKGMGKTLMVYTGYTLEQLLELCLVDTKLANFLDLVDILVDGRFIEGLKDLSLTFKGSRNQRLIDMKVYRETGKIVELTV